MARRAQAPWVSRAPRLPAVDRSRRGLVRSTIRRRRWAGWVLTVACAGVGCGADWPQFRGPVGGSSVATDQRVPVAWSDTENVAWKVDLPGRGPSSPIVVAGRVIVTCSSGVKQDRLHVLCFDARNGRRQWQRQFWATGRTLCHPTSANAAPTPASDGRRIYALYSSNDLICLDLVGNLQWYRGLTYDYPRAFNDTGMASSPLVLGETVVVQVENQGDSFAAGLDATTGQNRWRLPRKRQASWASPTALQDRVRGRDVLLLQSATELTAHDPETGEQLWQHPAECDWISSPVAVDGIVYIPAGGVTALRPAAAADRGPEVLWKEHRFQPSAASMLVHRGRVYVVNSGGVLSCGDAASGKIDWRLRLKGSFWATPVAVENRLYLINSSGLAQVVEVGKKGQVVAQNDFHATIQGSPAVSDGALFVRSDQHLWKISAP